MPLETAIVDIVRNSAAVTAILGATNTRLYADAIPPGAVYPAAAYQIISSVPISETLQTPQPTAGVARRLMRALVQVTIFAKSSEDRAAVAQALTIALVGWRGTSKGVDIQAVLPPTKRDTYNGETGTYWRAMDFIFHHTDI